MFKSFLQYAKWLSLISAIFLLGLGLHLLTHPAQSLISLGIFFVVMLLASGISELAEYFATETSQRSTVTLLNSLLTIILAICILLFSSAATFASLLPTILSFWVVVTGLSQSILGWNLSKVDSSGRTLFWTGLLITLFGFIFLFSPILAGAVVIYMLSFALILTGIQRLQIFWRLHKLRKE